MEEAATRVEKVLGAKKAGQTFANNLREIAGSHLGISRFNNAEQAAARVQNA